MLLVHPPLPYRSQERGAFLVAVMVLAVVLGGLSLAFLQEGLAERTSIRHHETSLQALEIVEVGLMQSELEIRALKDLGTDGIGTVSAAYGGGLFEVVATQDATYPDRWVVRARGERDLSVRVIEMGLRRREEGYFVEGLFSRDDLEFNGSVSTDSYDSRLGTWDAQAIYVDMGGRHAGGRGHIGSNSAIDLTGSKVHIRGNAIPGPLNDVGTSGSPVIWGDTLPRRREIPLPPVTEDDFKNAYLANDNAELVPNNGKGKSKSTSAYDPKTMALTPKGQGEVVLDGGTYFFTDLTLSGGTTLKITGPCRIYVTGDLDLTGGGVINATGLPENCLVFAHPYAYPPGQPPSTGEIKLTGNSQAAFALYAPDRDARLLGTSDLFGAIVAKKITVSGDANFHYDEALRNVAGGTVVYLERLYWREVALPRR